MFMQCLMRPEGGTRPLGAGVPDGCGCWEPIVLLSSQGYCQRNVLQSLVSPLLWGTTTKKTSGQEDRSVISETNVIVHNQNLVLEMENVHRHGRTGK